MRTPTNERGKGLSASEIAIAGTDPKGSDPKPARPQRRCILSGAKAPRDMLVRLAISPEGIVLPDPRAKAPGRGAWISAGKVELAEAIASKRLRGALAHAFKGAALQVPADLAELIDEALRRALLERLGLELKAGHIVLGSSRIAEQARKGRVALLLHALDSSEDGRSKLDQAWRVGRDKRASGEKGMVLPLDRTALSVALGRENVVHLAMADVDAAGRVLNELTRLLHYLGTDAVPATASAVPEAQRSGDTMIA